MKPGELREGATYRGKTGKNRVLLKRDRHPYFGEIVHWRHVGDDRAQSSWLSVRSFGRWAIEEVPAQSQIQSERGRE